MDFRKLVVLLLVVLFLFMPLSFAADGDLKIPSVVEDFTLQDDGSLVVSEEIVYSIEGSVSGVYREIPLNDNQKISDVSVETPGYYNDFQVVDDGSSTVIKVWLYEDAGKSRTIYDADVKVIFNYTASDSLKVLGDVSELDYFIWGDQWNTGVDHLESSIHLPCGEDSVEYFNDPEDIVVGCTWTDSNTLTTVADNIGSYTSLEQHITMSKLFEAF